MSAATDVAAALTVDGRRIPFSPGDTLAAALLRAGVSTFRRSRRGAPRGLYCGIGVCNDCLVTVDGRINVRACVTTAVPEMRITTGAEENA
jgi:predicted molibdopterin-dependent oxidoreductase YjgC